MRPILKGTPLYYPDVIGLRYWKALEPLFSAMYRETEQQMLRLFESPLATMDDDVDPVIVDTGGIAYTARDQLNRLRNKFLRIFDRDLTGIIFKMLTGVDQHSKTSLETSLGKLYNGANEAPKASITKVKPRRKTSKATEIIVPDIKADLSGVTAIKSGALTISPDFLKSGVMEEQFKALTVHNVGLFKTIAAEHFSKVEAAVMDSITTGQGIKDLIPFFDGYSNGTKNYARLRAMDQTRKAFTSINMARMRRLGIKKFEWLHSHGSNDPRKLHEQMSGNIYEIDNPPYIWTVYNQRIYGYPGEAINCRCTAIPVYDFNDN